MSSTWLDESANHEPWNESSESKEERARRMRPVGGWLEEFAGVCDRLEDADQLFHDGLDVFQNGNIAESESLFEQALKIYEGVLGLNDRQTVRAEQRLIMARNAIVEPLRSVGKVKDRKWSSTKELLLAIACLTLVAIVVTQFTQVKVAHNEVSGVRQQHETTVSQLEEQTSKHQAAIEFLCRSAAKPKYGFIGTPVYENPDVRVVDELKGHVPQLIQALKSNDVEVRIGAVHLASKIIDVGLQATDVLELIARDKEGYSLRTRLSAVEGLIRSRNCQDTALAVLDEAVTVGEDLYYTYGLCSMMGEGAQQALPQLEDKLKKWNASPPVPDEIKRLAQAIAQIDPANKASLPDFVEQCAIEPVSFGETDSGYGAGAGPTLGEYVYTNPQDLLNDLQSEEIGIKVRAIKSLQRSDALLNDKQLDVAFSKVLDAVTHPASKVRFAAAFTLAAYRLNMVDAVPVLADAVRHGNTDERIEAARGLGTYSYWDLPLEKTAEEIRAEKDAHRLATTALKDVLDDKNKHVRYVAALQLRKIDFFHSAPNSVLGEAANETDKTIGRFAAFAIDQPWNANEQGVDTVIEMLSSADDNLRRWAAQMLGRLGARANSSIPVLKEALTATDDDLRFLAAESIIKIGGDAKEPVGVLKYALKDAHPWVRRKAAEVLGELGPKAIEAVSLLKDAIHDENEAVRKAAAEALRKIDISAS